MGNTFYKNRYWMWRRYVTQKATIDEIADECGVSHQTIYRYLVEYGFIKGGRKWSKN
jgi:response regulator of citrate/malate metabolism